MSSAAESGKERSIKVAIIEDHPLFRERLKQVIQASPGMTVCGEADDLAQALEVVQTSKPDIAIVDITLRNSSGLDLIRELRSADLEVPVLVLSMHDETLYAEKALRAGARGYLTKNVVANQVVDAIQKVLGGEIYLSEVMTAKILKWAAAGTGLSFDAGIRLLSERELQVFDLIGRGKNVKEVADVLQVGETTIHTYRARIKEKLGLKTGNELYACATRWVSEQSAGDSGETH